MSGFLVCGAPFLAVGLRSRLSTCLIIPMRRIISLLTGRYELNKMTSLLMCGFIAQLVEHRTGIAEVTGSNPVEALIFFFSGFFFPVASIGKFTARIILHFHL